MDLPNEPMGEGTVCVIPEPTSPAQAIKDMRLVETALRNRWPVTEVMRRTVVEQCLHVLNLPDDPERPARLLGLKIRAAHLLVQADLVNVRRERNVVQATAAEATVHTDRLRTLLSSPEGRAALAQLTATSQPLPEQQDTPPPPDSTSSVSSGNVSS